MMDECQFENSKSNMLSDYMDACEFLKKRWGPKYVKPIETINRDQRDSVNLKVIFGHPTA